MEYYVKITRGVQVIDSMFFDFYNLVRFALDRDFNLFIEEKDDGKDYEWEVNYYRIKEGKFIISQKIHREIMNWKNYTCGEKQREFHLYTNALMRWFQQKIMIGDVLEVYETTPSHILEEYEEIPKKCFILEYPDDPHLKGDKKNKAGDLGVTDENGFLINFLPKKNPTTFKLWYEHETMKE